VRAARGPASPRRAVHALGLALLAVVLLSPTVLPWYVLWAVVPLAAAGSARTATSLGAGCAVLCLTTWPSGRSVVRPPLYGMPTLAAAAVAALALRQSGPGQPAGQRPDQQRPPA
jgi:alpha-1,6-mannosyltransferase